MQTRADIEFMGRLLGMHTCAACDELEDARRYVRNHTWDPIANTRAQHRIKSMLAMLNGIVEQTRADHEFMADMLGLRPGVDYEATGLLLSDKPSLSTAVSMGMRDPVANRRAGLRIDRLLAFCGQIERCNEYTRATLCGDPRLLSLPAGSSPRHFAQPN